MEFYNGKVVIKGCFSLKQFVDILDNIHLDIRDKIVKHTNICDDIINIIIDYYISKLSIYVNLTDDINLKTDLCKKSCDYYLFIPYNR